MICSGIIQIIEEHFDEGIAIPPDIEAHLAGCPACAQHHTFLNSMQAALAQDRSEASSPNLSARIQRRIQNEALIRPRVFGSWERLGIAVVIIICVLIFNHLNLNIAIFSDLYRQSMRSFISSMPSIQTHVAAATQEIDRFSSVIISAPNEALVMLQQTWSEAILGMQSLAGQVAGESWLKWPGGTLLALVAALIAFNTLESRLDSRPLRRGRG